MKKIQPWQLLAIVLLLLLPSCKKDFHHCKCDDRDEFTVSTSVVAKGFNNPRGLKFGPDGNLYVAEGGRGGTQTTAGLCQQIPPPFGPHTGSQTGAGISMINKQGARIVVSDRFPSSQTPVAFGGDVSGVSDIAWIGKQLYALTAGAGCSHGIREVPNGVFKVNANGSYSLYSNLSAYQKSHPVAHPPEDFDPDGTWYSMISVGEQFFAVEPNHGELVKIGPSTAANANVTRIVDFSKLFGHIVPTAITRYNDHFYIGNLGVFPIVPGSSNIYKVSMNGHVEIWATGFSTVLGVVFDKDGRLYVLENTSIPGFPTKGTGRIVRVNKDKTKTIIIANLNLPTAITIDNDGNLYVSVWGFGPEAKGGGQVVKIEIKCKRDVIRGW